MIRSNRVLKKASCPTLKLTTTTKKYLEQSCFYFVTIPYNILRLSINWRRKNDRNIQWHKSWHWIWTLSLWVMSLVLCQWATLRRWKCCSKRTIVNVTLGNWVCASFNPSEKGWLYDKDIWEPTNKQYQNCASHFLIFGAERIRRFNQLLKSQFSRPKQCGFSDILFNVVKWSIDLSKQEQS